MMLFMVFPRGPRAPRGWFCINACCSDLGKLDRFALRWPSGSCRPRTEAFEEGFLYNLLAATKFRQGS
jgi:hypothetical protein